MITILSILAGFVLLLFGAESLLRGSISIAKRFHISPMVIGMTSATAARATAGTSTWRIYSVAYALDDRLSEANTARAVGLPRRW